MDKLTKAHLRHSFHYFRVTEQIIEYLSTGIISAKDNYYEEQSQINEASNWTDNVLKKDTRWADEEVLLEIKLFSLTYNLLRVEISKSQVAELLKRIE